MSDFSLGEKVLIRKIWGESCVVYDFLLISGWWGNRIVFQESSAQHEVTILHLEQGLGWCGAEFWNQAGPCGAHGHRSFSVPSVPCLQGIGSAFITFPLSQKADSNSCSSGKGGDTETSQERSSQERIVCEQGPGSASRDARNFLSSSTKLKPLTHGIWATNEAKLIPERLGLDNLENWSHFRPD